MADPDAELPTEVFEDDSEKQKTEPTQERKQRKPKSDKPEPVQTSRLKESSNSSYQPPLPEPGTDEQPFINNIKSASEVKHGFSDDFFMECLYISDHTEVVWTTVHMTVFPSKKSKWFTIRGDHKLKYNILKGRCMFIVGKDDKKVREGDRVIVKPNQPHKLSNYTDEEDLEIEIEYEGFLDMHGYLQHVIEPLKE